MPLGTSALGTSAIEPLRSACAFIPTVLSNVWINGLPFYQCFSWARLDQAQFWSNPFSNVFVYLGLGWVAVVVLRSCVEDKALGGLMSSRLELRPERLGPLATNVNVGMVELAERLWFQGPHDGASMVSLFLGVLAFALFSDSWFLLNWLQKLINRIRLASTDVALSSFG